MPVAMALHEDILGAPRSLPPALRILYGRSGAITVDGEPLADDSARLTQDAVTLAGRGEVWRYELCAVPDAWRAPADARDTLLLARILRRDPRQPFNLRLDRVTFAPGFETPVHGHHGQGIRRLIAGRLFMEIGPQTHRLDAGRSWFETGEEPVIARGLDPGTSFLRCMVLDAGMLGRSSFRAWTAADEGRPRNVAYRPYLDTVVTLKDMP